MATVRHTQTHTQTLTLFFKTSLTTNLLSAASSLTAGTTATVAVLRDGVELVVGSVGDSRALLCRKGRALKLTHDHTPDRKDEKERYIHTHTHTHTVSEYTSCIPVFTPVTCLDVCVCVCVGQDQAERGAGDVEQPGPGHR